MYGCMFMCIHMEIFFHSSYRVILYLLMNLKNIFLSFRVKNKGPIKFHKSVNVDEGKFF